MGAFGTGAHWRRTLLSDNVVTVKFGVARRAVAFDHASSVNGAE